MSPPGCCTGSPPSATSSSPRHRPLSQAGETMWSGCRTSTGGPAPAHREPDAHRSASGGLPCSLRPDQREKLEPDAVVLVGAAIVGHPEPPAERQRRGVVRVDDGDYPVETAVGEGEADHSASCLGGIAVPPVVRAELPADLDPTIAAGPRREHDRAHESAIVAAHSRPQAVVRPVGTPRDHPADHLAHRRQRRHRPHRRRTQPLGHFLAAVDAKRSLRVIGRPVPDDQPPGREVLHAGQILPVSVVAAARADRETAPAPAILAARTTGMIVSAITRDTTALTSGNWVPRWIAPKIHSGRVFCAPAVNTVTMTSSKESANASSAPEISAVTTIGSVT